MLFYNFIHLQSKLLRQNYKRVKKKRIVSHSSPFSSQNFVFFFFFFKENTLNSQLFTTVRQSMYVIVYKHSKRVRRIDERSLGRDKTSVVTLHSCMAHESVDRWRQQWGQRELEVGLERRPVNS